MLALVKYRTPGAPMPPMCVIGGARFCTAYVARGTSLPAAVSARVNASRLARRGVRTALFPPDYEWRGAFARRGIFPPPVAALYRATAAQIARCAMPQADSITLAAERVTPELRRAAESLCADVRYLTLAVPDGAALARELRRRFGAAVCVVPPDAAPGAGLTVAFGAVPACAEALRLDESLRVEYDGGLSCETLAALWSAGALSADSLRVRRVPSHEV